MKIVLATSNAGKVAELQSQLGDLGFEVIPQSQFNIPDAIENGLTFIENAILKARHACALTGLPSIADDSGLEVNHLKGAPGIYSARFAQMNNAGQGDSANIDYLLAQLESSNAANSASRRARFRCVLVYMRHEHDPAPLLAEGVWEGRIAAARKGDQGFGYDPVFYLPNLKCTAAELVAADKKRYSHRGQALASLKKMLADIS